MSLSLEKVGFLQPLLGKRRHTGRAGIALAEGSFALAAAPAGPATLIANDVTACTFNATAGTREHGGVALLDITVSRTTNGNVDRLRLLRQVQVENPS